MMISFLIASICQTHLYGERQYLVASDNESTLSLLFFIFLYPSAFGFWIHMVLKSILKRLCSFLLLAFVLLYQRTLGQALIPLPCDTRPNKQDKVALLPKPTSVPFWVPQAPKYPFFTDKGREVLKEARCLSDALKAYIIAWMEGKVSSEIPDAYLPSGYNNKQYGSVKLVNPDSINSKDQWGVRPAEKLDPSGNRGAFPDPNATYILNALFAPFGTKVVIEGQYPYARFFDIQVSPSFWPENYRYNQTFGVPEVPIVDVDIIPDTGSSNPFLPGADRNTTHRNYRVVYNMALGDPTKLNPSFSPPYYRGKGNTRFGSGIQYQGPWGAAKKGGHGRGVWDFGSIWIRYYAPDYNKGSSGGVSLPKVYFELEDRRRFYILINQDNLIKLANSKVSVKPTKGKDPAKNISYQSSGGWSKEFGIFRAISTGVAINTNSTAAQAKKYVSDLDKGVTSRGYDLPGAAHYEPSATSATYINYLLRGMSCEPHKVVVLTGKLPVTPRTRNGSPVMEKAEARYWSLVGYSVPTVGELINMAFNPDAITGIPVQAIFDEEMVKSESNRYILVISKPEDRPLNATGKNGITWMDWGPRGEVSWTLRWMSVYPDWVCKYTPDEIRFPWVTTDWASDQYDKTIIGMNTQNGKLGEYQPLVHYMDKGVFEKLGNNIYPKSIPIWKP